jgi:hypothetical protein
MTGDFLNIKIDGIEKLQANLTAFGQELTDGLGGAGIQASEEILNTTGLQNYPAETAANQPPTPYYVRGAGMQYQYGNNGKSEVYGTQFYTEQRSYTTVIGNRASYARYLGGSEQAQAMKRIGWRKLIDVAREKLPQIKDIYQQWIDRAIRRLGLKLP